MTPLELILVRGYPGSGKSTLAKAWVAESPEDRARISRDDLRATLFAVNGVGSHEQEKTVTKIIGGQAKNLLSAGVSVVVDNTNLRTRDIRNWKTVAHKFGASFSVTDVKTSADECVLRDSIRKAEGGRGVGEAVIRNFAKRFPISQWQDVPPIALPVPGRQYFPNPDLPLAYLWDLDGTLANFQGVRGPYETDKYHLDQVHPEIVGVALALQYAGAKMVYLSGRSEDFFDATYKWITEVAGLRVDDLFMRKSGDQRNDAIIKPELFFEKVAPKYQAIGLFDDRNRVTAAMREIGLRVFHVQGEEY